MQKRHISKNNKFKKQSYISLFSGAGVGCYGFQIENFDCIATVEILNKRIKIQEFNNKCKYKDGYICGDIRDEKSLTKLNELIKRYLKETGSKSIDVLIATPPCQGMSVINHKKNDEKSRNSLVVESIILTKKYKPKYFIFENVKAFLNTVCTDTDGIDKRIAEAIDFNLGGEYNILKKIINFKNYGCNSSRTRTLVIGVRKDIKDITPYDIFPYESEEKTLFETIGHLKRLKVMGEISNSDIYHEFKPYAEYMRDWISPLKEGESAFDYELTYPYKIVNGEKVKNKNKNGDKYKRQLYLKVAPCVHTRNDILASQNTIHPKDDRVFSIRELMLMMSIPRDFKWSEKDLESLNALSLQEKREFLKKEEMNIRVSIGEAVPTEVFRRIAERIRTLNNNPALSIRDIKKLIEDKKLTEQGNLHRFINKSSLRQSELINIIELANAKKNETSAYYTNPSVCFSIIKSLPDFPKREKLRILEPSVGAGSFLPLLFSKYKHIKDLVIDIVDIDENSLENVKLLLNKFGFPNNVKINFIHNDFLKHRFSNKYDLVVGNPPFGKIKDKEILAQYKFALVEKDIDNIYVFFLEKALNISKMVAFVLPKAFISSPMYKTTRNKVKDLLITTIIDYGEKGFNGVKIETISLIIKNKKVENENFTQIESYITLESRLRKQSYITEETYPNWLLYRNDFFDSVARKLKLNTFDVFRDRQITKKDTKPQGKFRVLKSRNIGNNEIINIPNYDCFVDDTSTYTVSKFINRKNCILVPNLTYKPRAVFLPPNTIVDGSVAILIPKLKNQKISVHSLEYFASEEFRKFYMIARNLGTRSLNIDSNSVFYFGILKEDE